MKRYIILLFALVGCSPIYLTDPQLASAPLDKEKYDTDLRACEEAQRLTAAEVLTGGMGAIPAAAVMVGEGKNNDMFKSTYTRRDECLQRKGYVLK